MTVLLFFSIFQLHHTSVHSVDQITSDLGDVEGKLPVTSYPKSFLDVGLTSIMRQARDTCENGIDLRNEFSLPLYGILVEPVVFELR